MIDKTSLINFSPSCERNKDAILNELSRLTVDVKSVLEVGSYSGQHALYFSKNCPDVTWQTSDVAANLSALEQNVSKFAPNNCFSPIMLDVSVLAHWPKHTYDLIFTANSLHIMSWQHVEVLFKHIVQVVHIGSLLVIYGPFKYQNEFTSDSNAQFEIWLKERDPLSGVRDFEAIETLANSAGYSLREDINMPANNQLLVFEYVGNNEL